MGLFQRLLWGFLKLVSFIESPRKSEECVWGIRALLASLLSPKLISTTPILMVTFFVRLCLWLLVLAGMTFFWVAVFDAGEAGLVESFARTASEAKHLLLNQKPPL